MSLGMTSKGYAFNASGNRIDVVIEECREGREKIPKLIVLNVDPNNTTNIVDNFKNFIPQPSPTDHPIVRMIFEIKRHLKMQKIDVIPFCVESNFVHEVAEKIKKITVSDNLIYIMGIVVIVDKLMQYDICTETSNVLYTNHSSNMLPVNAGGDYGRRLWHD